jgi:hypothetical protein
MLVIAARLRLRPPLIHRHYSRWQACAPQRCLGWWWCQQHLCGQRLWSRLGPQQLLCWVERGRPRYVPRDLESTPTATSQKLGPPWPRLLSPRRRCRLSPPRCCEPPRPAPLGVPPSSSSSILATGWHTLRRTKIPTDKTGRQVRRPTGRSEKTDRQVGESLRTILVQSLRIRPTGRYEDRQADRRRPTGRSEAVRAACTHGRLRTC